MKKPMKIMVICLVVVFGGIFGFKAFEAHMVAKYIASMKEMPTVSTMHVHMENWQPQLHAVGSVRAIRGVSLTTELAGLVRDIKFTPGAVVKKGQLLVQLDMDSDVAQLHALQANAALAKVVYKRDKSQYAIGAISKATLDADAANAKNTQALVEQQAAMVAKKTIRAPFAGRLGVCLVSPGQYVAAGDKVSSLQTFDPIYVDFYVPQQDLLQLQVGQKVSLENEALPGKIFYGTITTIDPSLDTNTRNVEVEATFANASEQLKPGMFAAVLVETGTAQPYLTLPQTAITFNPYGSSVYIVKTVKATKKGMPDSATVQQSFVTTGQTRGDQIVVLSGLQVGDEVVTSGQMKLKNNMAIQVNNAVQPVA
jgi:membrane fusion protein (multidrug efflux system)